MGHDARGQDARSPRGPRCIALVGPFQSGKTTLLEAILARTGAISKQGTIEGGTTVGDANPEARAHRMSTDSAARGCGMRSLPQEDIKTGRRASSASTGG